MQQRPLRPYDPPTVVGLRQRYVRGRRQLFGLACGRWFFGCAMLTLSVAIMCGASLLFYVITPPEQVNILVVGVDARGDSDTNLARTDSVMIVSIDPARQQISLLSIPRDVVISSRNFGRLPVNVIARNAELASPGSGMQELQASLERTFEITIHHHVQLDFAGFVAVVNAAGGVTVDVSKRIIDHQYPTEDGGTTTITFEPGQQFMDGATALIYTRTRHSDDDYNRAGRQQQVVQALVNKVLSPAGWLRIPAVTSALLEHTQTSMSVGHTIQYGPAVLLYGNQTADIETLVLTREYLTYSEAGQPSPNINALNPWLDAHLR